MTKTTEYIGNIIYENSALKRILVDGGYIEGGVYYYYLTDHLGNNRVVANQGGTMIQKTHYYPFGSNFATSPGAELQPYKYNGKELDQMHGLNLYDSGARMYDPVIPRTPTPDPHAENYYAWSPYAWVGNNPMNVIDPTGMDTINVTYDGHIDYRKGGESDIVNVTNKKGKTLSKTYELGTLKRGEQTKGYSGRDYAYIQINNAENSKNIFEFIADNTNVEWSNSTFLNKDNSISNYLTTSHNEGTEWGLSYLTVQKELYDAALLNSDHSHPGPSRLNYIPSGLPDYIPEHANAGDIPAASDIIRGAIRKQQPIPTFRFYVQGKGYRRYHINSTYKQFKNMPDYYFEK